jgi:predicted small lipoprotein YifL
LGSAGFVLSYHLIFVEEKTMKRTLFLMLALAFALLLAGCGEKQTTTAPPTLPPAEQQPTTAPTQAPTEAATQPPAGFEWLPPITPEETFSRTPITEAEQATFDMLAAATFVDQDPIQLAIAIKGVPGPIDPILATDAPTLTEGTIQTFWIHNSDTYKWEEVEFILERVTEHGYMWFDTGRELVDRTVIDAAAEAFEEVYALDVAMYGPENIPGVDGDPHIYVLHSAATHICNVSESTAHQCGILGYFSAVHKLPPQVEPRSNGHEMFIMNLDAGGIGGERYRATLIHELRHMIEDDYDPSDDGWEIEGTAMFAETLRGDFRTPAQYANQFTPTTDLQLNVWTSGNTIPHYGKAYLFTRYLNYRLGDEAFRALTQHPGNGFQALDAIAQTFGFTFNAHDLWLDWMASVALIGFTESFTVPDIYTYGDDPLHVDAPKMQVANKFPSEIDTTVYQYGFDIIDLRADAPVTVNFTGTTKVEVIEKIIPASGQYMWWSGRVNFGDMYLEREVDLSGVETATLNYSVFYSIEKGWDFAYVLVSTDDGQTWQPLETENMLGEDPSDNPSDIALTDKFYTGRTANWINESADLTPYAGRVIKIRFQYITDGFLTTPGLVLDNISIPEIGFYDDVESLAEGWVAQGFMRVTAYLPQRFYLLLITFDAAGNAVVERIEIAADNTAAFTVPLTADSRQAMILVAASSPLIMTPASYLLTFSK